MHEGKHGIFDDMEDMDDLFGINEDHSHGHHEHSHKHKHHDHEHTQDNSENHSKKKFGLFKTKKTDK